MKHVATAFLFLFLLASTSLVAQIEFKKSFFIDNSGNKTDCLIKDQDWKSNPVTFDYKLSQTETLQTARIESVQEFQVGDYTRYIRKNVEIDRWDKFSSPSTQKYPICKSETLFLKVLVDGAATLYSYSDGSFNTYFYVIDGKNPEQLIQKQYVVNTAGKEVVYRNDLYKKQLEASISGDAVKEAEINNLGYFKNDFVKIFEKYNQSKGDSITVIPTRKVGIHISPRIGVNLNTVDVNYIPVDGYGYDFGIKPNLRVGVEVEAVLPFNRGKWAIAFEPAYTSYKADGDGTDWTSSIDYQALEVSLVARYYMFLDEKSKLFVNAGFVYSADLNDSKYGPSRRPTPVDIDMNPQFILGAGYKYNKISAEFRYLENQGMVRNQATWRAHYSSYAFILGYEIF